MIYGKHSSLLYSAVSDEEKEGVLWRFHHDGVGGLFVLGDGVDDGLGHINHDSPLAEEAVQLGDGLQLGLAGGGGLNALLKDGAGNLWEE